jgi:hypothetical protein
MHRKYKTVRDLSIAIRRRKVLVASMNRFLCAVLAAFPFLLTAVHANELFQFQAAVEVRSNKTVTGSLWVPAQADRIRGVLVGSMRPAATDPNVRQACAEQKLAIAVVPLDQHLPAILAELGRVSGYPELAVAPWLPWGHSAGTVDASYITARNNARCFGAIIFKGGLCWPPELGRDCFRGVPIVQIKGQFEEFGPGPSGVLRDFETTATGGMLARDEMSALRTNDERNLVSVAIFNGETHMVWTPADGAYAAQFIRKAAQRRIPDWPVDAKEPVICATVDPASGALTSPRLGEDNQPAAANYADYKGDKQSALWHFDVELARANDALHAPLLKKKTQYVSFADAKGNALPLGHDMRLRLPAPEFVGPDIVKFRAAFLDAPPKKYPPADGPLGHAEGPILFRGYGALEPVGPDTFRVWGGGGVLAYHPGDAAYRYTEQLGRYSVPKLDKGEAQTISFSLPAKLKRADFPVALAATSDRGLPVRLTVKIGPAVIRDGKLELAEVPVRARWPLRIAVVASQFGSAVAPLVQSAEPVEQKIEVTD